MRGGSLQRFRLVVASAFVAAIVFAVPAADAVFFSHGSVGGAADAIAGIRAKPILQAGGLDEVLKAIEQTAAQDEGPVPSWFQVEVGFLPGARDVRVENENQVVGYVVDCNAGQALQRLKAHMEALGWKGVALGQVDGFTFVKSSGTCTWALVTCTQVATATSIVVRLQ